MKGRTVNPAAFFMHAGREPAETLQSKIGPRRSASDDDPAFRADAVNLKNSLRKIEPDPRDSRQILGSLSCGRLPFRLRSQ
jgi:hypothetical protein